MSVSSSPVRVSSSPQDISSCSPVSVSSSPQDTSSLQNSLLLLVMSACFLSFCSNTIMSLMRVVLVQDSALGGHVNYVQE
jgi:hypothetical protein